MNLIRSRIPLNSATSRKAATRIELSTTWVGQPSRLQTGTPHRPKQPRPALGRTRLPAASALGRQI